MLRFTETMWYTHLSLGLLVYGWVGAMVGGLFDVFIITKTAAFSIVIAVFLGILLLWHQFVEWCLAAPT